MKEKWIKFFKALQKNGKQKNLKIIFILISSNLISLIIFRHTPTKIAPAFIYQSRMQDSVSIQRSIIHSLSSDSNLPTQVAILLDESKYLNAYLHRIEINALGEQIGLLEITATDLKKVTQHSQEIIKVVPYHPNLFSKSRGRYYEIIF